MLVTFCDLWYKVNEPKFVQESSFNGVININLLIVELTLLCNFVSHVITELLYSNLVILINDLQCNPYASHY